MKSRLLQTLFVPVLFLSCSNTGNNAPEERSPIEANAPQPHSGVRENSIATLEGAVPQNIDPVLGYRFIISGDFDGDGKKEKLVEHYCSALDDREAPKFYEGLLDYEQLVDRTIAKKPYCFVSSDNKAIDTLPISSEAQSLGLSYLKNEGDLNGDGTDEVSYVVNWADWSSTNTWYVVTCKGGKWKELYSFPIWDWQLPDLPETFNEWGFMGLQDKSVNTSNDTVNRRLQQELDAFSGLLKKVKTNVVQVVYRNSEAEMDTMIVDLKVLK